MEARSNPIGCDNIAGAILDAGGTTAARRVKGRMPGIQKDRSQFEHHVVMAPQGEGQDARNSPVRSATKASGSVLVPPQVCGGDTSPVEHEEVLCMERVGL